MMELRNLTQIAPRVIQHCLSGHQQPVSSSSRNANPALISGSDSAKENTWAVCVGRILSYPLSLPLSAFAYQHLPLIFPLTCWEFSLSLQFWIVFSSYGIVPYKVLRRAVLSIYVNTLLMQVPFTSLFLESLPLTPAVLPCSHNSQCYYKDNFSTPLIWNQLSLSVPQLPFLLSQMWVACLYFQDLFLRLSYFLFTTDMSV